MTCTDSIVHEIEHVLETNGNKSRYPLCFGKEGTDWTTTIEVDSPRRTFDVEAKGKTLMESLRNALTALRREFAAA
jgi:hypothetical protein